MCMQRPDLIADTYQIRINYLKRRELSLLCHLENEVNEDYLLLLSVGLGSAPKDFYFIVFRNQRV